jgi:hypothetical protein
VTENALAGALLSFAAAVLVLASCGDPSDPLWEDAGEHREPVTVLEVADTIAVNDTLAVVARGFSAHGRPSDCRWESVRSTQRADLTLWVRSDQWVASSDPPPYALDFECRVDVVPPFSPGTFLLVLHEPDATQWAIGVVVVP